MLNMKRLALLALFAFAFVCTSFYKQDRAFAGREEIHDWFTRERLCVIGASVLIVACISISLNNIISMTPLVTASVGYQEANANFYGSTLVLELISSALMTPILEELVFRGILFTRLKSMIPKIPAILPYRRRLPLLRLLPFPVHCQIRS